MIPPDLEQSVVGMQYVVGANVRQFRTTLGLSLGELAARIGSDERSVTAIENGQTDIDIDTLAALADALRTGAHVLVNPEAIARQ